MPPSHIKEATAAETNDFETLKRDFAAMQADLKTLVQALSDKGQAMASEALDGMSESSKRMVGTAELKIRQKPLLAVLLAFVAGLILGRLFASRR
jgi:ElaB/YqjD/DUF883 family membrane-anchored ribosome-binding protein